MEELGRVPDEIMREYNRAERSIDLEGDPCDNLMKEYDRAERSIDLEGDPYDNLMKESSFKDAEDCDKENVVRPERREWRESVNNSLFRVVAQVDRSRTYSFENLLQAATSLAENCLRRHVTLPGNPDDLNEPILLHDGVLLPSCSCAFKGCSWEYTCKDHSESKDDHLHMQHPWDRKLRQHILDDHVSELKEVLERSSEVVTDDEVFRDYLFAFF